jgi:hypothetical protein
MSPLLAHSGHGGEAGQCPLSGPPAVLGRADEIID